MTEPIFNNMRQELEHVQTWAQALGQVLGQVAGTPVSTAVSNDALPELTPPAETDVWILGAFSGGLRGELALRLPAASALELAQIFMSEPVTPEATLAPEHHEAVLEFMRQIAGLAATALKTVWGEVQLRLEATVGAPSWPASSTYWLRAGNDTLPMIVIELHLSAAMGAALRPASSPAVSPAAAASSGADGTASGSLAASLSPVNLDLLMDVELGVILRFGSRHLPLHEILDLTPGSVVDLDREISEPVDMLLDGRLVARGEVVVVNGCYGLRVIQVAP